MKEEYKIEKNNMFCFLNLVVYGKMQSFEQEPIQKPFLIFKRAWKAYINRLKWIHKNSEKSLKVKLFRKIYNKFNIKKIKARPTE